MSNASIRTRTYPRKDDPRPQGASSRQGRVSKLPHRVKVDFRDAQRLAKQCCQSTKQLGLGLC